MTPESLVNRRKMTPAINNRNLAPTGTTMTSTTMTAGTTTTRKPRSLLSQAGLVGLALWSYSSLNLPQHAAEAYYLPGVNMKEYKEGDVVELKVNSLKSEHNLLPLSYYKLPYCPPKNGPKKANENFGELMAGEDIETSPYVLNMMKDMYCEQLCIKNAGKMELTTGTNKGKFGKAIDLDYHNHWIVDNLPSAHYMETTNKSVTMTTFMQGFPVGRKDKKTGKTYLHNHVNIDIWVNDQGSDLKSDTKDKKYRVVRFLVEPFSIGHDFVRVENPSKQPNPEVEDPYLEVIATIHNPIPSCDPSIDYTKRKHTSWPMLVDNGALSQNAYGDVLFTYDVIWEIHNDIGWAERWNDYLNLGQHGREKNRVHWMSVGNSLIIAIVLSVMVAAILVRNLQRDIRRYNRVPMDEEARQEELEEYGWKLVHADVFRPPSTAPMFLAVACGTGAQLLGMVLTIVAFATLGFMSPARRGHLLMGALFLFVVLGGVNGYITARLYKTFKGKSWQQATMTTAFGFPGLAFIVFLFLNLVAMINGSTDAVPFWTMLILIALWFGISTPLVFFGAFFGYRQDAIEFPVNTSSIPRQIPDQPWFMGIPFTLAIGGILPFGACFVEYYFILTSVWQEGFYYFFSFLLLVLLILFITCAEITVLFTYFQLCSEDYHWWWRSFCNAGAIAIYFFLYSIAYFRNLHANTFTSYVLYFGYMGLASLAMFTMTGFTGMMASLWFNKVIFASIKID